MKLRTLLVAVSIAFVAAAAHAQAFKAGAITIDHPYARATGAGQGTAGGYMKLVNAGPADRLISIHADISDSVEVHEMTMDGNVMKMRQIDAIELPSGKTVELQPGGYHVMFVGLKAPLKSGDSFPLMLRFEKAGAVTVEMKVEGLDGMAGMKH